MGDLVWEDSNANGVQDAGEAGLANVTVELLRGATVIATTTTDASGHYSFSDLVPGTYSIAFGPPSGYRFSNASQGNSSAADSDVTHPSTGQTEPFTLSSGQTNNDIDAGVYAGMRAFLFWCGFGVAAHAVWPSGTWLSPSLPHCSAARKPRQGASQGRPFLPHAFTHKDEYTCTHRIHR